MRPTSVFVGGVGDDICREDLEREFSKYGKLNNIWVAQNPPGFAFIEYDDDDDANEAIKEMNGAVINGSRIRVEISHKSGRGGRGDRRGGRGRGFRGGRDGGFRGRGGGSYGMPRRGGYDSYGDYNRYGSGGGRMSGSRYGSDDQYDGPSYGGMGGGDYKGSSYRSRSPVGQRNGSSW